MPLFSLVCEAYLQLSDNASSLASHAEIERVCADASAAARLDFVQACVCYLWRRQLRCRLLPLFWKQLCQLADFAAAAEQLLAVVATRRLQLSRLTQLMTKHAAPCVVAQVKTHQLPELMVDCDGHNDVGGGNISPPVRDAHILGGSPMDCSAERSADASVKLELPGTGKLSPTLSAHGERSLDEFVVAELRRCLCASVVPGYEQAVRQFYTDATADTAGETDVRRAADITARLADAGVFGLLAADPISRLMCDQLSERVERACAVGFGESWMERLRDGCGDTLRRWQGILPPTMLTDAEVLPRLVDFTFEAYARHRIDQLFDMIVDFPESRPALCDLHACLQRSRLHGRLVDSLKRSVATRLLHPAAATDDILSAYVAAVRALRMLEPSGVLVELVGEPIRQYLRRREDTVRCIISSLTEDDGGVLADELMSGDAMNGASTDADLAQWRQWTPYPRDAPPPSLSDEATYQRDILSMLVSIYGSKSTFVKEYRKLLADRVLKHTSYDLDREYKYLELLKLRFGESEMHECDVMLKDIFNSQRINSHIRSGESVSACPKSAKTDDPTPDAVLPSVSDEENSTAAAVFPVSALILSAQFWPEFREDTLVLPEAMQSALDDYTRSYQTLKGNRTLLWRRQLGSVRVEVEVGGRCLELDVTPTHAVMLHHFMERFEATGATQLSLDELSRRMRVPTSLLRRKATLWVSQGVLTESAADVLQLNTSGSCAPPVGRQLPEAEEDSESVVSNAADQKQRNLDVFWNYIVGMLTNLESLPLDRIQSMLRVFALDEIEQCSSQELRHFLDKKVREHKLTCTGGLYRLPK